MIKRASAIGLSLALGSATVFAQTVRCDPDSIGTQNHSHAATQIAPSKDSASDSSAQTSNRQAAATKTPPAMASENAAPAAGDGGSGYGDGTTEVRKHNVRWQSFLPGVIK